MYRIVGKIPFCHIFCVFRLVPAQLELMSFDQHHRSYVYKPNRRVHSVEKITPQRDSGRVLSVQRETWKVTSMLEAKWTRGISCYFMYFCGTYYVTQRWTWDVSKQLWAPFSCKIASSDKSVKYLTTRRILEILHISSAYIKNNGFNNHKSHRRAYLTRKQVPRLEEAYLFFLGFAPEFHNVCQPSKNLHPKIISKNASHLLPVASSQNILLPWGLNCDKICNRAKQNTSRRKQIYKRRMNTSSGIYTEIHFKSKAHINFFFAKVPYTKGDDIALLKVK